MDCEVIKARNHLVSWYEKKTKLEKTLINSFAAAVLVVTSLSIAFGTILSKENATICLTPVCVTEASETLEFIDRNVDPCDSFYQFACGGFLEKTNVPEEKSHQDLFEALDDRVLEQMRAAIENVEGNGTVKAYKVLKELYELCLNGSEAADDNFRRVNAILAEIGGWPVLEAEKWNENSFSRLNFSRKLRGLGSRDFLVQFSVEPDLKNSSSYVLTLKHPDFPVLPAEILRKGLKNELVRSYLDFIVDVTVLFGANRTTALNELKNSLKFEIDLAKISSGEEDLQDFSGLYNPKTIKELQHRYPSNFWLKYISETISLPNFTITNENVVVVKNPGYLYKLEKLLVRTPKRVQANFLATRIVTELIPFLNGTFREPELIFKEKLIGQTKTEPKWKECVRITSDHMISAANALYFEKYSTTETQMRAQAIAEEIRDVLLNLVFRTKWLDLNTKNLILGKVRGLNIQMGYPQQFLNDEYLEEIYADWEIESDNFVEAVKTFEKLEVDSMFEKLGKFVDKNTWTKQVTSKKAKFYSYSTNTIQIPTGLLQEPFFSKDRPMYLNFGTLGYIIGTEMGRIFDEVGLQFNEDGNLEKWWPKKDSEEVFQQKIRCVSDDYAKNTGLKANPSTHLNENIAANVGIKLAHLAYRKWMEKMRPEGELPGLNYNPDQLFWISTAKMMCTKYKEEYRDFLYSTGKLFPNKLRVELPLKNSQDFTGDFNCPQTCCKMNPAQKCIVW